jgi:Transposase IS116/IS110/IS902 family
LAAVVIGKARAPVVVPRLPELQRLAAGSAGLTRDIDQLLRIQTWLLRQLRVVEDEVAAADREVAAALEGWPVRDRAVLGSFPNMSILRQAILLSAIGDVTGFQSDRQLRKLLGWYPEAVESGTSVYRHRLGQKGNRLARREVWLWVVGLLNPRRDLTPFRVYYQRLRDRGMAGNVAVGHVAGKLISVLFACLRKGELTTPTTTLVSSVSAMPEAVSRCDLQRRCGEPRRERTWGPADVCKQPGARPPWKLWRRWTRGMQDDDALSAGR